jgi:hypothetical protein
VNEKFWPKEKKRVIELMKRPEYQTVLSGRQLIYVFTPTEQQIKRFQELLKEAKKHKLNPYCVYMGWHPPSDYAKVKNKGFDAVSSYAKSGSQKTFTELVTDTESDWNKAADSNSKYIPLVTTGWDKTPRQDNKVSWEKDSKYHSQKIFPSRAKPEEIASHLSNALNFVKKNKASCPSQAIIVYAWNEYDEGGWLAPTLGLKGNTDFSRLKAIRTVLLKQK